jgi:hypothetical protein
MPVLNLTGIAQKQEIYNIILKIQRFVKNEDDRNKLKEYMRQFYPLVKDIYKYYSTGGLNPAISEFFCIPFNTYIKIIHLLGIVDGELLKSTDLEIDLISLKNNLESRILNNPDKVLILNILISRP